ncbi:MAG: hypothetical protein LBM98_09690 [Oscillospiraceae bacterium]|nr:hypothetical protein [Oscillospiraceae bacterium]
MLPFDYTVLNPRRAYPRPSPVPAPCAVFASAGELNRPRGLGAKQSSAAVLRYRMLCSRHWIAAPISLVRIASVPRLAMTDS